MTFEEYLYKAGAEDREFEAIIDNSDMPATFSGADDFYFSDHCRSIYGELLDSQIEIIKPDTDVNNEVIQVFYNNYGIAKDFCLSLAGYIGTKEYDRLFPEKEKTLDLTVDHSRK